MEISYDEEADALYIKFGKGSFSKNKKVDDNTILDLDDEGKIIGVEILDASKMLPKNSLKEVSVKNFLTAK